MRLNQISLTPLGRCARLARLLLVAGTAGLFFCQLLAPATSAPLFLDRFFGLEKTPTRSRVPVKDPKVAVDHEENKLVTPEEPASHPLDEVNSVPLGKISKERLPGEIDPKKGPPWKTQFQDEWHNLHNLKEVYQNDFDDNGHLHDYIDIHEVQEILVNFADLSRPARKAVRIPSDRGPPLWGWKLEPRLLLKASAKADPDQFAQQLWNVPFKQKQIRFVSLVYDTATERAIRAAAPLRDKLSEARPDSLEAIRSQFKEHTGSTFIIMGHVEGGRFVANDPTGWIDLVNISLQDLQREAAKAGCKLVLLGCGSASANVQAGIVQEFNPIDAVTLLTQAVQAETDYEFYRALTSDQRDITLLLDQSVLTDRDNLPGATTVSFAIYSGKIGPQPSASGSTMTPGPAAVAALLPTLISAPPQGELE